MEMMGSLQGTDSAGGDAPRGAAAPAGGRRHAGGVSPRGLRLFVALCALALVAAGAAGCGRKVEMPNVVGMGYASAQQELRDSKLDVRYVEYVAAPAGVTLDTVVKQTPVPGAEVEKDAAVTLTLAGKGTATVPDLVGQTQDDAAAALATAGLAVGKVQTVNDAETEPGRVVSQAPAPGTGVPVGSAVDLKVSRSVVVVTVPDVTGLTQEEAQRQLKDAGLAVEATSAYSDSPAGQVVEQAPATGSSLNEGGTVTITVSQGAVPVVAVPNVMGQSQSAATGQLQQAGFQVTVVKAYSTSVPSGTVAGQNPPSGVFAERGATVQITVSQGAPPPDSVTIPDVSGQTQSAATQVLEDAGFAVEVIKAYSDGVPVGSVMGQAPTAGLSSPKGATVTIAVSTGPAPAIPTTAPPTTVP